MFRRSLSAALVLAGAAVLSSCDGDHAVQAPDAPAEGHSIGLFSSLPIAFGEGLSMTELLSDTAEAHWATIALAKRGKWRAIEWLGKPDVGQAGAKGPLAVDGGNTLENVDLLVMAQPRPLAPEENVALDEYIRGGGRVLLFADPALTQESRYGLGDKRRPAQQVLLSPILSRWGLVLQRDEDDDASSVLWNGNELPLAQSGMFRLIANAGESAGDCSLEGEERIARCEIGKGRLLAFADAALLEPDEGARAQERARLLDALLESVMAESPGKLRD